MSITVRRIALIASTACALGAGGLLTGPASAQALPPIPAAPACTFPDEFVLNQDNGFLVKIPASGTSISGSAVAYGSDSKAFSGGPATGGIDGDEVNFTIDWSGPSKGKYTGTVDPAGNVNGTTRDVGQPGSSTKWNSAIRLVCVAAPPDVAPEPAPAPKSPTATVTGDVDVYDEPGGDGNVIGVLQRGTVVKVLEPCPADDWCTLADGRYVFGEFLRND